MKPYKPTEFADPVQDFWTSVSKVHESERDIDRLERQMEIELRDIDVREGKVDGRRFEGIVGRAVDLQLIDPNDALELSGQSRESVKAAFDFVKASARSVIQIAEDPYKYEKLIDKTAFRDAKQKRRHFCDLTS
jgi:hypothetical protein